MSIIKNILKSAASRAGFEIHRNRPRRTDIADWELYRPLYSPWFSNEFQKYYSIAAPRTIVSPDRCYVLYTLLKQALNIDGDVIECGVYKGGTASIIARVIAESAVSKKLYLFDTFSGMPETDEERGDVPPSDFADTTAEDVERFLNEPGITVIKKGIIPETFVGLESLRFAFAHIDVVIYKSVIDSLVFIWPRLLRGGFIVLDDYGFACCADSRRAVDKFFSSSKTYPLCLPTGQAVIFRN
ncbi:MAG TPA: TylF/MycF/NovP-related O-methyltransferase [Blastocatellia bacterium]|nr:TylF/MycF/NovP-related O-methyltransferase [Blastocatellia bacterium]